jgi:hypothetical protein
MKIDLTKGVYIQIGGELGKHNSVPVDNLIRFAQDLQLLVQDIAKYDIASDEPIDLNNFKLELIDFKTGSAVPQFAFTQRKQETLGNTLQAHRQLVNDRFEEMLEIAQEGDYTKLRILYPEPFKRNIFIENLYSFSNDFGNSPVSFSEYRVDQNKFVPVYKIHKFKSEVKKELISEIIAEEISVAEEGTGYAKVRLKSNKKGKLRPRITQLYRQKSISLNFAPDIIIVDDLKYILKFPLRCYFEKEDDFYVIHSEMLDIIGTGLTEDDAEKSFSEEFAYLYQRLNELPEEKLSAHFNMVKSFLNQMVDKIENA